MTWIKLLTRVDPKARDGFGFEGEVYRPGDVIARRDLPEPALFLELAGPVGEDAYLWILWRYDRGRYEFRDLAQVRARGAEWAWAIRPIAMRELHSEPDRVAEFDYIGARDRILSMFDAELEGAPAGARRRLSAMINDQLLGNLARSA